MKISDLIILNTELWWEWTKVFPKTKDINLPWEIRQKACQRCEEINTHINQIINQIDDFWDS